MTLAVFSNANGTGGSLKIGAQDRLVLNSDGTLSGVTNPAQFDKSFKLATTGFVQQALGNYQDTLNCSANTTVTPQDAGKAVMLFGLTAYTVQFPSPVDMPQGARFKAICTNPAGVTVTCVRPNSFMSPDGKYAGTFVAGMGDVLEFIKIDTTWVINGTLTMFTAPQFKAQLTSSGWQKLPSGLILQWGTYTNTNNNGAGFTGTLFPIAFPTAALSVSLSALTSSGSAYAAFFANIDTNSVSKTAFGWIARTQAGAPAGTGTQSAVMMAIGY